MKKLWLLPIAALGATFAHGQSTSVSLSGFNFDGVANGFSSSGGDTFDLNNSITGNLDSQFVYFEAGVDANNPTAGLPTSGQFTSAADNSTVFKFANYTGDNLLLLTAPGDSTGVHTGTLSFAGSSAYSKLSILETGFNGGHNTGYTINFGDGSTQTGSFTALDNFNNSPYALAGFGRVQVSNCGFDGGSISGNNPRLYQVDISIETADLTKSISSITFTNNETTFTHANNVGIWAISGVQAAPEPMSMVMLGFGALALIRRRK